MAIARQRLEEALAQSDLAKKKWIPDLTVGTAYYRHEGGIQDFTGELVRSSYGSLFAGHGMRRQARRARGGLLQPHRCGPQGLATKKAN